MGGTGEVPCSRWEEQEEIDRLADPQCIERARISRRECCTQGEMRCLTAGQHNSACKK